MIAVPPFVVAAVGGGVAGVAWWVIFAWWKYVLAVVLLILAGLIIQLPSVCRGTCFNSMPARTAAIVAVALLGDDTAERLAMIVSITNAHFDPAVRNDRGKWGILTPQRRNSCGSLALQAFHLFVMGIFIKYLDSPETVTHVAIAYAKMLVHFGFYQVARNVNDGFKSGERIEKINILLACMKIERKYFYTPTALVLVCAHLVLGDKLTMFLILRIIKAWCYWGGAGNIAPSRSPDLLKVLLYIAEDIDPLVKEFFVAWPAGQLVETADQRRVSAAYYLAQAIRMKCEHYDGLVAIAWNDAEQQKVMKDVMDDMHEQQSSKPAFLDAARAMKSFRLIAVGGAVNQDPGHPQLPPIVLSAKCSSQDLSWSRNLTSAESIATMLVGPIAALVCAMLADNEDDDVETFPNNETLATLTSMTYTALDPRQSIFAGRVVTLVAIPLGPNGKLLLEDALRWEREGEHSIENVASNEILSRTAQSVSEIGSVLALRARVEEQSQAVLNELAAAHTLMMDRENRIAEALEKARANGNEPRAVVVLYQQTHGLGDLEPSEAALRSFESDDAVYNMRLGLAKVGVSSIEARTYNSKMNISDRLADALPIQERSMAPDAVIVVPRGHVFESDTARIRMLNEYMKDAAYNARWLTTDALPTLFANPSLFDNIDNSSLDLYRPYKLTTAEEKSAWKAASVGGVPPAFKFDKNGSFRTTADVPKRTSSRRQGGAPAPEFIGGIQKTRKTATTKKPPRDLEAELKPEGTWNLPALQKIRGEFQDEVDRSIAATNSGTEYQIKWGGENKQVKCAFQALFKCTRGKTGGRTNTRNVDIMTHFISVLDGVISSEEL
ncbi:unnamed protein product [Pelagomonas calceolata]|uniref:Uncharacterized protein n=1 Tax=Pelagomonas calceolata TaxID=35677 RepID=A0A8J2SYE2_9STRA|nr:unnamed protein product [Pelagomonas calceolata]|mmetsp:Transcript_27132/g.82237  ORF Transcript_27132/g.82237 Transcript_27132/m.82237 type:complete len:838 (-) Transcript_27132:93-2606(-)